MRVDLLPLESRRSRCIVFIGAICLGIALYILMNRQGVFVNYHPLKVTVEGLPEMQKDGAIDSGIRLYGPTARPRCSLTVAVICKLLPYFIAGFVPALLVVRIRLLSTVSASILVAIVLHLTNGVYEHMVLPSGADFDELIRHNNSMAAAVWVLSDIPTALPWRDYLSICFVESVAACIVGLFALVVASLMLRVRHIRAWVALVLQRLSANRDTS